MMASPFDEVRTPAWLRADAIAIAGHFMTLEDLGRHPELMREIVEALEHADAALRASTSRGD